MKNNLHIGCMHWQGYDGVAWPLAESLTRIGCKVTNFSFDEKLPVGIDAVLAYGPFNSLYFLTHQLKACQLENRPLFALWQTEQFPNPKIPECIRASIGNLRSYLDDFYFQRHGAEVIEHPSVLYKLISKGTRFRYYSDIFRWEREKILSLLIVTSKWTANFLGQRGLNPMVAYLGGYPENGKDLGLKKDIPVLWIGKIGSKRRKRLLEIVRKDLSARGIDLLMIDGIEHPYVFGDDRTVLLNRTKIVLNIMRESWDDNSFRFYLAAPNRAMIISEPTLQHTPFTDGIHMVEAPVEQIGETIAYYLNHEEERQHIANQAYRLVDTELNIDCSVEKIIRRLTDLRT